MSKVINSQETADTKKKDTKKTVWDTLSDILNLSNKSDSKKTTNTTQKTETKQETNKTASKSNNKAYNDVFSDTQTVNTSVNRDANLKKDVESVFDFMQKNTADKVDTQSNDKTYNYQNNITKNDTRVAGNVGTFEDQQSLLAGKTKTPTNTYETIENKLNSNNGVQKQDGSTIEEGLNKLNNAWITTREAIHNETKKYNVSDVEEKAVEDIENKSADIVKSISDYKNSLYEQRVNELLDYSEATNEELAKIVNYDGENFTFKDLDKEENSLNDALAVAKTDEEKKKIKEQLKDLENSKYLQKKVMYSAYLEQLSKEGNTERAKEVINFVYTTKLDNGIGDVARSIWDSAQSIGLDVIGGLVETADDISQNLMYLAGEDVDISETSKVADVLLEDSSIMKYSVDANASDFGKFVNDTVTGQAPFWIGLAIGRGVYGGNVELANTFALINTSLGVYGQTVNQLTKEGYSYDVASRNAMYKAFLSYASESVGGEAISDIALGRLGTDLVSDTFGYAMTAMAKTGFAEAVEEGYEAIADPLIDSLTLKQSITPQQYFDTVFGIERDENGQITFDSFRKSTYYNLMVGFIGGAGGGLSSGFKTSVNYNYLADNQDSIARQWALENKIETLDDEAIYRNQIKTFENILETRKLSMDEELRTNIMIDGLKVAISNFNNESEVAKAVKIVNQKANYTTTEEIDRLMSIAGKPDFDRTKMETGKLLDEYYGKVNEISQKLNETSALVTPLTETQTKELSKRQISHMETISNFVEKYSDAKVVYANLQEKQSDGSLKSQDGLFDRDTKTIIINPYGKKAVLSTFAHEFVHSIENTNAYKEMKNWLSSQSGYSEGIKKTRKIYGENVSDEVAESEYMAIKLQNILENGKSLKKLLEEKPTVFRQLLNDVNDFLNRTNTAQAKKAYKMLSNAVKEVKKDTDFIEERKNISKQWSYGGENTIELLKSGNEEQKTFAEYMLKNLTNAKEKLIKGTSMSEIWNKYGWFRNTNGKWYFETFNGAEKAYSNWIEQSITAIANFSTNNSVNSIKIKANDLIDKNSYMNYLHDNPTVEFRRVSDDWFNENIVLGDYESKNDNIIRIFVPENIINNAGDENKLLMFVDTYFNTFIHELQHNTQSLENDYNVGIEKMPKAGTDEYLKLMTETNARDSSIRTHKNIFGESLKGIDPWFEGNTKIAYSKSEDYNFSDEAKKWIDDFPQKVTNDKLRIDFMTRYSLKEGLPFKGYEPSESLNNGEEHLSKQQELFFKNSKTKNDYNQLKILYSGTDETYTVVDGKLWLTDIEEVAETFQSSYAPEYVKLRSNDKMPYGSKVMQVYANIENPLRIYASNTSYDELGYAFYDTIKDNKYSKIRGVTTDWNYSDTEVKLYITNNSQEIILPKEKFISLCDGKKLESGSIDKIIIYDLFGEYDGKTDINFDNDNAWVIEYVPETTRSIADIVETVGGYDGVLFSGIYTNGNYAGTDGSGFYVIDDETEKSDVWVTFLPNQVKSIYNFEPTNNNDIRWSKQDDFDFSELENQYFIDLFMEESKNMSKKVGNRYIEEHKDELTQFTDEELKDASELMNIVSDYAKNGITSGGLESFYEKNEEPDNLYANAEYDYDESEEGEKLWSSILNSNDFSEKLKARKLYSENLEKIKESIDNSEYENWHSEETRLKEEAGKKAIDNIKTLMYGLGLKEEFDSIYEEDIENYYGNAVSVVEKLDDSSYYNLENLYEKKNKRDKELSELYNLPIKDYKIEEGNKVVWTNKRIDSLIKQNEYSLYDLFVTKITPQEYLDLSWTASEKRLNIIENETKEKYSGKIDTKKLGGGSETSRDSLSYFGIKPYDLKNGETIWQVTAQEGNHRTVKLRDAGFKSIPILITLDRQNSNKIKDVDSIVLSGHNLVGNGIESFDNKNKAKVELMRINENNRDLLYETVGESNIGENDIAYSKGEDIDEEIKKLSPTAISVISKYSNELPKDIVRAESMMMNMSIEKTVDYINKNWTMQNAKRYDLGAEIENTMAFYEQRKEKFKQQFQEKTKKEVIKKVDNTKEVKLNGSERSIELANEIFELGNDMSTSIAQRLELYSENGNPKVLDDIATDMDKWRSYSKMIPSGIFNKVADFINSELGENTLEKKIKKVSSGAEKLEYSWNEKERKWEIEVTGKNFKTITDSAKNRIELQEKIDKLSDENGLDSKKAKRKYEQKTPSVIKLSNESKDNKPVETAEQKTEEVPDALSFTLPEDTLSKKEEKIETPIETAVNETTVEQPKVEEIKAEQPKTKTSAEKKETKKTSKKTEKVTVKTEESKVEKPKSETKKSSDIKPVAEVVSDKPIKRSDMLQKKGRESRIDTVAGQIKNREYGSKTGYYDTGIDETLKKFISKAGEDGYKHAKHSSRLANASKMLTVKEGNIIEGLVGKDLTDYKSKTLKQMQQYGIDFLKKHGLADSYAFVSKQLNVGNYNPHIMSVAYATLNEIGQEIDGSETVEWQVLATKIINSGTEVARTLNMYRIPQLLGYIGKAITLETEIERMNKKFQQIYGEGVKITVDPKLIKEYGKSSTTDARRQEIFDTIAKDIASQIPNTLYGKLQAFRHMQMLFGVSTAFKNVISNVSMGQVGKIKRQIAGKLEESLFKSQAFKNLVGKDIKLERQAGTYDMLSAKDRTNWKEALKTFKANYRYKGSKYSSDIFGNIQVTDKFKDAINSYIKPFDKNNPIGKALNMKYDATGWLLSDSKALENAFCASMVGYANANGVDINNMSNEMLASAEEYSINQALKDTFNYATEASKIINDAKNKGKIARFVLDTTVPFTKTTFAVADSAYNYSPVGLLVNSLYGLRELKTGKITANEYIDNLASGLTGTGIVALGYMLSAIGFIKIKKEDDEMEYVIDFGDVEFTADWFDPFVAIMAMGTHLQQEGLSVQFLKDTVDSFIDTTIYGDVVDNAEMLSSLIKKRDGGASVVAKIISTYLSSFESNMLRKVAKMVDPIKRKTYSNEGDYGSVENTVKSAEMYLRAGIPYVSKTLPAVIDENGNEKQNGVSERFIDKIMEHIVLPGKIIKKETDEIATERERLQTETGTNVTSQSNITQYENAKLTDEEFEQYNKTRNKLETELVNTFISSDSYQSMSDEDRANMIDKLQIYANAFTKNEYLKAHDSENNNANFKSMQDAIDNGISPTEYVIDVYNYNSLTGNNKKKQFVEYLNSNDYSTAHKNYMYDKYYGDNEATKTVNSMEISEEQKYNIKYALSTIVADEDENGLTVSGSKSKKLVNAYKELGVLNTILETIKSTEGVKPSYFGITTTQYKELIGETKKKNIISSVSSSNVVNNIEKYAKAIRNSSKTDLDDWEKILNDLINDRDKIAKNM